MANSFEDLVAVAADDGASVPWAPWSNRLAGELSALFEAWQEEHHQATESQMLLDRACRLLGRIVAEGEMSPKLVRSAESLIQAAKAVREGERSTERP